MIDRSSERPGNEQRRDQQGDLARFYARSIIGKSSGSWQGLAGHLRGVATRARAAGERFGVGGWCELAAWLHDLGKVLPEFQQMLRDTAAGRPKRRVDHSSVGAAMARNLVRPLLRGSKSPEGMQGLEYMVPAVIAAHHGKLPAGQGELGHRLENAAEPLRRVMAANPPLGPLRGRLRDLDVPPMILAAESPTQRRLRIEMLIRMVLSALVNADRLDAERVGDIAAPLERRASLLRTRYASVAQLREAVDLAIDAKVTGLDSDLTQPSELRLFNYRQAVLSACRKAARLAPQAFTLDVATGGGKTLSSLSFALNHAEIHGLERVIVAIPFTSIIEQTAEVFRQALGSLADNVVEHHSAAGEMTALEDTERFDATAERHRLSTENWDAPLIVTTGVQLFESMYASSASRCRKLANIARSVIILDEAQTLPPHLLHPIVWVINELVESYGATIVLSTATQPSLEPPFPTARDPRPIVSPAIATPPPRVRVELLSDRPLTWPELATELARHDQVLAITHRRKDARELTLELDRMTGSEDSIHLSALMCAAHRSQTIATIHQRLAGGGTCRVVSTQLVEAGVDLDFPVVYRTLAGLDSMIQAAGRANREGRLGEEGGLLRIFRSPTQPPLGLPRFGMEAAETMLLEARASGRDLDLFSTETAREYFRRYYSKIGDMDGGIEALRRELKYQEVDQRFRFIESSGVGVLIPFDAEAETSIDHLRSDHQPWLWLRRLQRYIVNVYPHAIRALRQIGAIEPLLAAESSGERGMWLATNNVVEPYDERFGLDLELGEAIDPETFIT